MRGLILSALMLAAIGSVSGVANAQAGLTTGLNPEGADRANRIEEYARRELMGIRKEGIDALQAQDFVGAEKSFGELASRVPTLTDAHYLLGVAKLGLKKWDEAKQVLEIAVKQEPRRPEPKSRLGVTYVRLNDFDSAMKQRAELASMDKKCKGACSEAAGIAEGLALLDKALAAKPKN